MRKKRILVIESSSALQDLLARALAPRYEVDVVGSAAEALQEFRHPVHAGFLIEMSLAASHSAGLRLLRNLREHGDERPVIATAAAQDWELAAKCYEAGADGFLAKPYRIAVLLALLGRLFSRAAHARAAAGRNDGILLPAKPFTFAGATISAAEMTVTFRDRFEKSLTPKELGILAFFRTHRGSLVRRKDLLAHVWGPNAPATSNSLNTYLSNLRRLFAQHGHPLAGVVIKKPKSGWLIREQRP